jgi:hypothetical protein
MEINIGISECDKNVDNYYGRNFGSHAAPAERLSTVSSPFMVEMNTDFSNEKQNSFTLFIVKSSGPVITYESLVPAHF